MPLVTQAWVHSWTMNLCTDPRHATPCPQPCPACKVDCGPSRLLTVRMNATISPCSWMYPGSSFQLRVTLESGGDCYLQGQKTFSSTTVEDAEALCSKVVLVACKCGSPAFNPTVHAHDTNRNGQCEACFMRDLTARFAVEEAKENRRVKLEDRRMIRKGFTHKAVAWVHPAQGGDDYMVDIYFPAPPTDAEIKKVLRNKGSHVLNDYTVTTLTPKED